MTLLSTRGVGRKGWRRDKGCIANGHFTCRRGQIDSYMRADLSLLSFSSLIACRVEKASSFLLTACGTPETCPRNQVLRKLRELVLFRGGNK